MAAKKRKGKRKAKKKAAKKGAEQPPAGKAAKSEAEESEPQEKKKRKKERASKKKKGAVKKSAPAAEKPDEPAPNHGEPAAEPETADREPTAEVEPAPDGPPHVEPDEPPHAGPDATHDPAGGPTPVEDLDAVLDDDLESAEAIDQLIAEAVAVGELEEAEDEPELETVVIDEEGRGPRGSGSEDAAADTDEPAAVVDDDGDGPETRPEEPVVADIVRPGEPATAAVTDALESADQGAPDSNEEADAGEDDVDLGPVSSPEFRDRLLAQALAHAELQDARYRVPFSDPRRAARWKGVVAALLFLLAGTFAVAPPAWVQPEPPATVSSSQRLVSIHEALLLQAEQVEAFRVRTQRLPDSLEELPARLEGIRFVRSGSRAYQLIAYEADGNAIIYDSSNPSPRFSTLGATWVWRGGNS